VEMPEPGLPFSWEALLVNIIIKCLSAKCTHGFPVV
jgi:hypothetical protein